MTPAEALDRAERIRLLVAYVQAWRDAHRTYRAWRNAEWRERRARYRLHERACRRALIEALRHLSYDARGRVRNDTGTARRRLRDFRKASDRSFATLLQAGRRLFGVQGGIKPDPKTGLFTGQLEPSLRLEVEKRLGHLMSTVREGIANA